METRSRKSKSRTPFTQAEDFSREFIEKEGLRERSVRVTRRTTTFKVSEGKSASLDEVTSTNKEFKTSFGSEEGNKLFKTSDYSSEEGENEYSSSRSISQNERNQIIEDARAAVNGGGEISALSLYKKSGRYWEMYPKTDYTYSPISKDRVEIAPGVVAMPNMSRKNIHSVHSTESSRSFNDVEHKETNTDTYLLRSSPNSYSGGYVSRQLFNNNYEHTYRQHTNRSVSLWSKVKTRTVTAVTIIITRVVTLLSLVFLVQTACFSKLHKLASNVMLMDTWLLRKNSAGSKAARLTALCLVPLLLLAGWWFLLNPYTSESTVLPTDDIQQTVQAAPIIEHSVPPPPINDINRHLIDDLRNEIAKLKSDMLEAEINRRNDLNVLLTTLQHDNKQIAPSVFHRVNRCCKNPMIDMEAYVHRVVVRLLNDHDFLKQQKGLTGYLHTIFTARQELEWVLGNLTSNFGSKYEQMLQESSLKLMDSVNDKIMAEISRQSTSLSAGAVQVDISEDRVKQIVKSILAIYDADKTGLVDYAMESMGAQILSTKCTENYYYGKAVVSVLGIPLWYPVNSPRTLITPGINPGQCWAFQSFPAYVMIRLAKRIVVQAFSIEHISKLAVPNGDTDSAPKHFEVYGLNDENEKEPLLLGEYKYDTEGEPLQYFDAQVEGKIFEIVELRIYSNHGNPNYTCLYRFRVHGKMV